MEAKSDTLNTLYSEYLAAIRHVILQIECQKDIDLCTEWLAILNNVSPEQKMARNCLAALMYQQLKATETLGRPFRNRSNLNKDLDTVLQDLGIELNASTTNCTELDTENFSTRRDDNEIKTLELESCRSVQSAISRKSYHIQQIDDLNTFFINMKTANDHLHNEIRKLRKENEILFMKNEQKNVEMRKILDMFKSCPNYDINPDEIIKEITIDEKHADSPIHPIQEDENISKAEDKEHGDGLRIVQINEEDIFNALNNLLMILKASILDENPLETISKVNIIIFRQMFEKCSNATLLPKIALYENNIQTLAQQLVENIKSYHENQLKSNELNEAKHVCNAVSSKASQTRNVTYKSSSDGPRHSADFKVKYLRKCLLKMQSSKERLVERYENQLKEQLLQNRLQQKILKLKVASISSKIFLHSNYKNQEELLELTNHLEAKYKLIIADAIERMKGFI